VLYRTKNREGEKEEIRVARSKNIKRPICPKTIGKGQILKKNKDGKIFFIFSEIIKTIFNFSTFIIGLF
jgi:hypothetical protein